MQQYSGKYRPKNLEDLVATEATKKQIANLIKRRNAHAILITGPTGTGKTTTARIIARGINNCPDGEDTAIDDVVEMSLTDKNKVEDMRNTVQVMRIAPSKPNNLRIFILDEAQGATGAALSQLLKVLEEPPHDRVMVILCTNEPWRLQATLINRCVPIVLKAPSLAETTLWLRKIMLRIGKDYPKSPFASLEKEDRAKIAAKVAENCGDTPRMALQLLQTLNNGDIDLSQIESQLQTAADVAGDAAVARIMLLWMKADASKLTLLIRTVGDADAYVLLNRLTQATNGFMYQMAGGGIVPQIYPIVKILNQKLEGADPAKCLPRLAHLAKVLSDCKAQTITFADNPANVVMAHLSSGFLRR